MSQVTIEFKKMHQDAIIPVAKTNGDVGMDIHSVERVTVGPGETVLIDTGLQLANVSVFEPGLISSVLIKIEGRSGLASKGIFPTGGIVDPCYRGVVKVALNNITKDPYTINVGDRIAQFVIYPVISNYFNKNALSVKETDVIADTERGTAGFGSSGR